MNPINDHDLLTLREFANALGITLRRARSWADAGAIGTLQPQRHAERLVPAVELLRFERMGYRVRPAAISATSSPSANPVPDAIEAVA